MLFSGLDLEGQEGQDPTALAVTRSRIVLDCVTEADAGFYECVADQGGLGKSEAVGTEVSVVSECSLQFWSMLYDLLTLKRLSHYCTICMFRAIIVTLLCCRFRNRKLHDLRPRRGLEVAAQDHPVDGDLHDRDGTRCCPPLFDGGSVGHDVDRPGRESDKVRFHGKKIFSRNFNIP